MLDKYVLGTMHVILSHLLIRQFSDIVTCQSLARRLSSVKKLNLLRAQKRDINARLIQFAFKILTEKLRFNKVLEGMNTKSHVETYAAVVIQTIMRGYLVKRHLTLGRHYASIVQAFTRKSIAQKNYRRTIQSKSIWKLFCFDRSLNI